MSSSNTLADVYKRYRHLLLKVVGQYVPRDEAEDLVQEAFVRSFQADKEQPIQHHRHYMLTTVKNLAMNHLNSAAVRTTECQENIEETHSELLSTQLEYDVEQQQQFALFCRATETLSDEVRRVFLLKKVYGMRQRDIAELVGLSESTVEKHVAKGLSQCARYLQKRNADSQANRNTAEPRSEKG